MHTVQSSLLDSRTSVLYNEIKKYVIALGEKGMEGNLLKVGEIAKILHISLSFAYTLMRRGDIRTVRIGNAVRVRPEDLELYIHERSIKFSKGPKKGR